jgi:hypothetical protein
LADLRWVALTGITATLLMPARRMATMGRIGLPGVSLLALARGMGGAVRGVGAAGDGAEDGATVVAVGVMAAEDGVTDTAGADAGTLAAEALRTARWVVTTGQREAFTVEQCTAVAASTVVVDSMAEADTVAVGIGNRLEWPL